MISLEQKGRLLNKSAIFLKISLDLTKLSEVRKAGDQSDYINFFKLDRSAKINLTFEVLIQYHPLNPNYYYLYGEIL